MKSSSKYRLGGLLIFHFVFCFYTVAFAETDIYGGVISADTTWTNDASSSPYIIHIPTEGSPALTVGVSTTLTICLERL